MKAHEIEILLRALWAVRNSTPRVNPFKAGIDYGYALSLVVQVPAASLNRMMGLLNNASDMSFVVTDSQRTAA